MIVKKIVKGLGWLVVGIVAFAAALTAYFYIGGIEWGDWPIPDETELLHRKCDLMDKDNAYVALMALTNIYHVADSHEYQGVSDEEFVDYYGSPFAARDVEEYALCAAVRNDPDSPKRAEKILSANSDFFESFHVALKIDGFCAMARATTNEYAFSFSSLPSYKPIILFAKLVMLRAQVALERDDVDAAMADIVDVHSLGEKIMTADAKHATPMVGYLVGNLLRNISYRKMMDVISMDLASEEILEKFGAVLDIDEACSASYFAQAARLEIANTYVNLMEWARNATADNILCGDFVGKYQAEGVCRRKDRAVHILHWPGYFRFAFHRRETMFRFAAVARAAITNKNWPKDFGDESKLTEPGLGRWLLPNCIGADFQILPLLGNILKEDKMNGVRPRLVIAAAKWRKAHGGENPPTFDALVPDYLVAVPRDPWSKSGEPIKYDAASGVAWSIGKDGKYDYQKVAKDHAAGNKISGDSDTQKYTFRLDGKPVSTLTESIRTNEHPQTTR